MSRGDSEFSLRSRRSVSDVGMFSCALSGMYSQAPGEGALHGFGLRRQEHHVQASLTIVPKPRCFVKMALKLTPKTPLTRTDILTERHGDTEIESFMDAHGLHLQYTFEVKALPAIPKASKAFSQYSPCLCASV